MVALVEVRHELDGTEGFAVESGDAHIGSVEEIWRDASDRPRALVVRRQDGTRALLQGDEVITVDGEYRWVVVPAGPKLLELDAPRPTSAPERRLGRPHLRLVPPVHIEVAERPLWQQVALLYSSIFLVATLVISLAFAVAWLVTGAAY